MNIGENIDDDQIEQEVRKEWSAILDAEEPNLDSNFFLSGGNSLMAVELVERLGQRLGIALPLDAMFVDGSLGAVIQGCIRAFREKA